MVCYAVRMSAWAVSLSADDIYADIYYEFFELYNEGYSVKAISNKLVTENKEIWNDPNDLNAGHTFWFALAKAQWECKQLEPAILARVSDIIANKKNITAWRALGASENDLKKRQVVLDKFMSLLCTERPKPRLRKKPKVIVHKPAYSKGDCLTFKFSNGHYGGALVLEAITGLRNAGPYNLIAFLDIDLLHKPERGDFKRASVIHNKNQEFSPSTSKVVWVDQPALYWALGANPKDTNDYIEVVATISVKKNYGAQFQNAEFIWGGPFNEVHIQQIERLLVLEKQDNKKHNRIKIKKFIGSRLFF